MFAQVADDRFTVEQGITYRDGSGVVEVSSDTLVDTDLASIPLFMAWFVPVNGRHTPAALVHDTLVANARHAARSGKLPRRVASDVRADSDDLFLRAMGACGVPLLRRLLMHAAVSLATRWDRSAVARAGILLWVLASLVGSVALVWSCLSGRWLIAVAAVVAPALGGLLWGPRRWRSGVLAGYAAWVIGLPALATALGYGAYWLAEQVVRPLSARTAGDTVAESPRPAPYR